MTNAFLILFELGLFVNLKDQSTVSSLTPMSPTWPSPQHGKSIKQGENFNKSGHTESFS